MSFRDDYHTENFGPAFLDKYRSSKENTNIFNIIYVLHKLFDCIERENIRIERLLEIGSGPSPSGVISAGKLCTNITLSEYSTGNRIHLKNWHENKIDMHPSVLKMFQDVSILENIKIKNLINRTRKNVQEIIFADLMHPSIVPEDERTFDFILVNFAFLNACMNEIDLEIAMKNVYNKLTNDGYLFLQENNKHSALNVDGKEYHNLMIDDQKIEQAAYKAGFVKYPITEELRKISECFCLILSK